MSRARDLANRTIASAALPKAGGAMTGAITTNSTFDGIDVATRDGILTSTTTTAGAALPKAGGTMSGNIVMGDDTSIGIADDAERIEFDGDGDISVLGANLGVGTATPLTTLNIQCSSAGDQQNLMFFEQTDAGFGWMARSSNNANGGELIFQRIESDSPSGSLSLCLLPGGNVGIGTTAPRKDLEISNPVAGVGQIIGGPGQELWLHSDQHLRFIADTDGSGVHAHIWYIDGMTGSDEVMRIANDGAVTAAGGFSTSDERLKENITTITGGLETINALTGKTFTWKEEADMQAGTHYGLIAQELEAIVPDLVYNKSGIRSFDVNGNLKTSIEFLETDEYAKSISMEGLIPVLIEAVKELSAKVTALESA